MIGTCTEGADLKFCAGCQETKPLDQFFARRDSKCGVRSKCKECFRKSDRQWAAENPEAYREANRVSTKSWYERNKALGRRLGLEAARKFAREHPREYLLRCAKERAKQYGRTFNLELDDIVIPTHCPILGIELAAFTGLVDGKRNQASPSLDRVDSSLGYVKGNVRVISMRANRMKQDCTVENLRAIIEYMEGKR